MSSSYLLILLVLVIPYSHQCERKSTNDAVQDVIASLKDLTWALRNNVSESFSNSTASFETAQGRGSKDHGLLYLIPLLIGTKTAGLTAAAFTVIKLFIIQAFIFSKLALLSLAYLILKKLIQYNSIRVYKAVAPPPSGSAYHSLGYHDIVPSLHLPDALHHTDGLHAHIPDTGNAHSQYSTILQNADSHAYNLGSAHHEDTSGFTPSSGELTGLGSHASPDLQGQFSISSQNQVALRPANDTSIKADDRIFNTYPFMNRKRTHYPFGIASVGSNFRHRIVQ